MDYSFESALTDYDCDAFNRAFISKFARETPVAGAGEFVVHLQGYDMEPEVVRASHPADAAIIACRDHAGFVRDVMIVLVTIADRVAEYHVDYRGERGWLVEVAR